MAEPTESRTNKSLIIPDELGRPSIDPGLSDLKSDTSYDLVEAARVDRAATDSSYDQVEATRADRGVDRASADTSYDQVEATRADRGVDRTSADTSYEQLEAARAARMTDAEQKELGAVAALSGDTSYEAVEATRLDRGLSQVDADSTSFLEKHEALESRNDAFDSVDSTSPDADITDGTI